MLSVFLLSHRPIFCWVTSRLGKSGDCFIRFQFWCFSVFNFTHRRWPWWYYKEQIITFFFFLFKVGWGIGGKGGWLADFEEILCVVSAAFPPLPAPQSQFLCRRHWTKQRRLLSLCFSSLAMLGKILLVFALNKYFSPPIVWSVIFLHCLPLYSMPFHSWKQFLYLILLITL